MAIISDQQFDVLNKMLSDPQRVTLLSRNQLKALDKIITEYKTDREERVGRLRAEGLNDEQIARVDAAFKAAPPPQEGQRRISEQTGQEVGATPRQVAGVIEGVKQAGEGIRDLAEDIAVAINVPEATESRDQWKAIMTERRLTSRLEQIEQFGQLPAPGWELFGQVAPFLAALPAAAESFWGLVTKRAMQGGVIGATVAQESGKDITDRLFNASVGSFAGIASNVFNIWRGIKRSVANNIVRRFNAGDAQSRVVIEKMVQRMAADKNFGFSLSQVTGGRFELGLEVKTATQATKAQQNRNLDILAKHILTVAEQQSGRGLSAGQIAKQLRETLKRARKSIYKSASDDFGAGVDDLLEEFGDDVVIRGRDYLDHVDRMVTEAADEIVAFGAKPSKNLLRYRDRIDIEVNPMAARARRDGAFELFDRKNKVTHPFQGTQAEVEKKAFQMNEDFGGIDTNATLRILKGLNKLIGGETVIFDKASTGTNRNLGRALMGTFAASLEAKEANGAAVAGVNAVRKAYKDAMARAEAIDNLVVTAHFGGKKLPKQPEKRLDIVLKQEAEELGAMREFLEEWDKPLLEDLRATHMKRIVRGAEDVTAPDVDTAVSLNKFAKRLSTEFQGAGSSGKGLHTAAVQKDMVLTARALRIINNKYFTGIAPGGINVDDFAINAISRSPEFMARFLSRLATSSRSLEKRMLDPLFRSALQDIADINIGKGALNVVQRAAMIYLAIAFNQDDEMSEELSRQLTQQQTLEQIGKSGRF